MRLTLGVFAICLLAGAPFSALAQTFGPAPADEYFGPHQQSVLEIRNRLDRLDGKSDSEMLDPSVLTEVDDIDASIIDWQHQYPNDPWLPHAMARLMRSFHRAGAASTNEAVATLNLMRHAYPDSAETSATVAMVYGGADLTQATAQVQVPVPVQAPGVMDAWARFDAMRSGSTTTASSGP